jgi:ankyrin repeat protein
MVAPLLAGGANPNIILEDECPPLMLAAVRGNANVVRLLLEHGANPTLRYKGRTACDLATQAHWGAQQYDETIELLNEATNKREKRKNESDENSTQKKQKTELK